MQGIPMQIILREWGFSYNHIISDMNWMGTCHYMNCLIISSSVCDKDLAKSLINKAHNSVHAAVCINSYIRLGPSLHLVMAYIMACDSESLIIISSGVGAYQSSYNLAIGCLLLATYLGLLYHLHLSAAAMQDLYLCCCMKVAMHGFLEEVCEP